MNEAHTVVLIHFISPIDVLGGAFLFIVSLLASFRRDNPRWLCLLTCFAGLWLLGSAPLAAYVKQLRTLHDPMYWRFRPLFLLTRFVALASTIPLFVRYICLLYIRLSKRGNA